jgi:tetratricopeptide (TPR) repeat protein
MAAIGHASGDRRLQSQASSWRGWLYAQCSEWQEGLAACQQALEYAPDAFEAAINLGFLGYVYLEKGKVTQALPMLESAVQAAKQYRSQQEQNVLKMLLGEAYRMNNQLDQAKDFAMQGYEISRRVNHPWGIGLAQRILGRIAHTSGNLPEAEAYLQEALATFSSLQAQYDLARTHLDLASLAHSQGNYDIATMYLSTAYAWFKTLQVPKWVEKTERLAREYGVTLTKVGLEELTEGSP